MECLLERPHAEAVALAASGAPVFLTVNPAEYHGPHLSLHNDELISQGLLRDLHARLAQRHPDWPLLFGGALEVGVEPAPGPGSRFTPYGTVRALVQEACRRLIDLGAQRVVLMTFHGNPLHGLALEAGVRLLRKARVAAVAPMNELLRVLLELDPSAYAEAYAHVVDPVKRAGLIRGLPLDFHAGLFETSLALHYAPASVSPRFRELPPCPEPAPDPLLQALAKVARGAGRARLAQELSFAAHGKGWLDLSPHPGYTGEPALATAQAGAYFAEQILRLYVRVTEGVFEGVASSPAPIMPWLASASLGGRLA